MPLALQSRRTWVLQLKQTCHRAKQAENGLGQAREGLRGGFGTADKA